MIPLELKSEAEVLRNKSLLLLFGVFFKKLVDF